MSEKLKVNVYRCFSFLCLVCFDVRLLFMLLFFSGCLVGRVLFFKTFLNFFFSNMAKKTKDSLVGLKHFTDADTGEVLSCYTYTKTIQTDTDFYKVWLIDLLNVFETLGGAKIKVINYILKNIIPSNNIFLGTIKEISQETGISQKTVNQALKLMVDVNFFRKMRNSYYMVNPDIIVKGDSKKRHGLLIKYSIENPQAEHQTEQTKTPENTEV